MADRMINALSPVDKKEIQGLSKDINDEFFKANESAMKAVGHYIKVGQLLADVRKIITGDSEYGKWRAENTTLSQSWANKLTRVYETYGDQPPRDIPISTLAELTTLPPAKRKELEEQAADEDQKTPSVRDVKKVAKEERLTGDERVQAQLDKKEADKKKLPPAKSVEEQAQEAVDLGVLERLAIWGGIPKDERTETDAFILLGLPPYFDGKPNVDTVIMLIGAFRAELNETAFDECYSVIKQWMKG